MHPILMEKILNTQINIFLYFHIYIYIHTYCIVLYNDHNKVNNT